MRRLSTLFAFTLIVLGSCSPSVKILGSWTSPSMSTTGYEDIFVTALTENILARQTVEQDLDNLLNEKGVNAQSSFNILPPGFKTSGVDKNEVLQKIKALGSDAILTVAVLDQTNETRYVPGTTMYSPMGYGYYGRFWGYYSYYNPVMYDPGYYTTDKNYYLEANLYDAETEELVWSSQSETTNPASIETFSKTFSETIVSQLIKDGLIIKE
ncbi:hypothetical protein [Algoriphagus zhangzhouensis]|uniref:DUF4136 domain-containing protein n=1 Tax=Algoriphagus zhangzhouensis TaxID=1073327 RepID=A0A1M7ZHK7_9BACT|nr:hypothetical protein [Algoriphagus zhangzhouensis]TDY44189.1 hypothetical protein A8938_3401 [Algoriphagus zhangzhouensis]SHO64357.1 hypothetical protein SAMN04488108_3397 [Algoriphagus zhangzhouensis]